jgi:hypothetical protein
MKSTCVSTFLEENPGKIQAIEAAYRLGQKASDDGLAGSLNYGSSTVKHERATPEEIEKRLIGN